MRIGLTRWVVALSVYPFAFGGGLAAEQVWSGLDRGSWGIYGGFSTDRPLQIDAFPPGSDLGAPALSPDGSRLAIEAAGQGIGVCSLENGACTRLRGVAGVAARPAWNPETGEVIFALYRIDAGSEDSDLWVAGPNLENPRPLVVQTGNQDDPDVSPDGRSLVYSSSQTVLLRQAATRVVRHLWMMDLVTGAPRLLSTTVSQDLHPDWSPDGRRIAFASDRSGQFEIWVMSLDGGELRRVTAGEGSKSWPAWSPDGRTLLFTWLRNGRYALMKVEANASEHETFAPLSPGSDAPMRDADWR